MVNRIEVRLDLLQSTFQNQQIPQNDTTQVSKQIYIESCGEAGYNL